MRIFWSFLIFVQIAFILAISPESSLASKFTPFDSPDFCSQIITPTCNTTFSYIDELNKQVRPILTKLIHTPFFKYFKLDLDKQCKFWNAQHFCATENCAVEILPSYNWSEVDDDLRPSKLGEINRATSSVESMETSAQTCEDLDYCHIDDDHQCVYVNLLDNPERFTGYGGSQSFDVWKAIYSENCFPNTNPMSMTKDEPEQCIEKNLFYRLISGLHASIAVHLSNEYLDPNTGEFYPNLKIFMERVGKFNDRLSNIYFNYALVSQAIVKLNELISIPQFINQGEGDENQFFSDTNYNKLFDSVLPSLSESILFNTSSLFNPDIVSPDLKNEFRSRFKNVSAIMDCVGCDRCRMWGKLQTIGYGTSLKILFELEDPKNKHLLKFRRIELVALFNTFDRLSKSIEAINRFKNMYSKHLDDVSKGLAKPGEYEEPQKDKGFGFPFMAGSTTQEPSSSQKQPQSTPKKPESPLDKIKSNKKKSDSSVYNEFAIGIKETLRALRFIYDSYVGFPRICFQYLSVYLNGWWNVFIGKEEYVGTYNDQGFFGNTIDDNDEIAYSKKVVNPLD